MKNCASGFIRKGHGIASGKNKDKRFPKGTLFMQAPFFTAHGLNMNQFFLGTINASLSGYSFHLGRAQFFFPQVKWCKDFPPEDFSFFSCTLQVQSSEAEYNSLIYWPHPSTKPGFYQDPSVLEILAPKISNINYGDKINISADSESVFFCPLFDRSKNS